MYVYIVCPASGSSPGRCEQKIKCDRERERDKGRETERKGEKGRERERKGEKEREREGERERGTEKEVEGGERERKQLVLQCLPKCRVNASGTKLPQFGNGRQIESNHRPIDR